MSDDERGAFERIQETDPSWADVATVIRFLARERLAQEKMLEAISAIHAEGGDVSIVEAE